MQNPELCKELLQRILPDLEIDCIEYPELQKSIRPDIDARSIRLDVYVKDNRDVVYDIEMQVSNKRELPKRSRYYQSMIDLQLIDKGQYYEELNQSYVIFICAYDVFGKGRHIYTFENICKEDNSILMEDEAVNEAKKNREWRHEYMTLLMRDQENQRIGEEIGEKRGEEMLAKLIMFLSEDGRSADIIKVSQDKEYRHKLYAEYRII